jgi:tetratricopeptide (TPR) repeat protein
MNSTRITTLIFPLALLGVVSTGTLPAAQSTQTKTTRTGINRIVVKARFEIQRKQYDGAILDLSSALRMRPDAKAAAEILGERGGAYVEKGELNKAMADAEEAVRLSPAYFRGYQVRGRIFRHRGEVDKAIREFNTALKLAPNFAQLYNNRGNAFSQLGQEERAIQDYSEAIRRAPRTIDGYVNRGGLYTKLGRFDKAIADLDVAISINPGDSDSYSNRGQANKGKHNYKLAISDYKKALELSPHDPDILNNMAWLKATCPLDSFRNGKEALNEGNEACRLTNWRNADDIDTLAAANAEVGDFERAVQYATIALKMKIELRDHGGLEKRLALYRNRTAYRDR